LWLFAALGVLTALGCATPVEEGAPIEPSDEVSSSAQALSADPGPKNAYVGEYLAHFGTVHSDGTYVYVRYRRDHDKYCFGRVLRMPVGGGDVTQAEAPCLAQDFAIGDGDAYFAVVTSSQWGPGGIYRVTFGDPGEQVRTALTTTDAQAIAIDGTHIYWADGASLHKMLPDGSGGVVLAADTTAAPASLFVEGKSLYGYDGGALWALPKKGGAKVTLATVGPLAELQLDRNELFWLEYPARIMRLPITGGTPSTFYEADPLSNSVRGLAVAGQWVYWSTGTDLKRQSKTGDRIVTIDSDEPGSEVLGADATNVYYSSMAWVPPPYPQFRRLPIADLVAPVCDDAPRQIASVQSSLGLAAAGTWVYFADTHGNAVRRVWKNGGSVETVADNQPAPRPLHASAAGLVWTTPGGVHSKPWGANFVSATPRHAAYSRDVVGDLSDPLDPFSTLLYYNDDSRIVGPDDTTLATGVTPYRLAADEHWVYWTDRGDQTLNRVPRAGGDVEVLVRLTNGELGNLALGPAAVFYTVTVSFDAVHPSMVMRVPKSGGTPKVVGEAVMNPFGIAVSGSYVFFSAWTQSSPTLYRVDKGGGPLTVRATGDHVGLLDTLGACVVYTTAVGVNVVSKL